MKKLQAIALFAALALTSAWTHAAEFCVGTSNELRQALMTAGSNGEADTIKIGTGTYSTSGGNVAFAYSSAQNFGLSVSGGYVSLPPNLMCYQQHKLPSQTVLSGSNARKVMSLFGSAGTGGDINLSNLTIRDGFTTGVGWVGGLEIGGGGGYTGNVDVTGVVIERNVSASASGGMSVYTQGGGIVHVRNNLFLLNRCASSSCAFSATVNAPDATNATAYFGNNTIVGNQCSQGASCSCTGARIGGSARTVIYNNAFALNGNGDLCLQGGPAELYNNNVVSVTGTPAAMSGNLAFYNPMFIDVLDDDFRLTLASPLVNAGTGAFALSGDDLDGNDRVAENDVDIGAYENHDRIFDDGFQFLQ